MVMVLEHIILIIMDKYTEINEFWEINDKCLVRCINRKEIKIKFVVLSNK